MLSERVESNSKEIERLIRKVLGINGKARELDSHVTVDEKNELKARLQQTSSEWTELSGQDQSARTPLQ